MDPLLVCRINPWIDLTSISTQACSIACRRGMRAAGHVVGDHIHTIFKPKKILYGLEMASIQLQIVDGWCTSSGPKKPDGNEHYPRQQQTWASLICPVRLHQEVHLKL